MTPTASSVSMKYRIKRFAADQWEKSTPMIGTALRMTTLKIVSEGTGIGCFRTSRFLAAYETLRRAARTGRKLPSTYRLGPTRQARRESVLGPDARRQA